MGEDMNNAARLRDFEVPLLNHTRYFGMFMASHSIPDSIIVLHMGTGCKMKGGMHLMDMFRESFSQVCWTEVSGVDIVSDSHDMLEDTVVTSWKRRRAGCVAVAASSVIDMTGFDMRAAIAEIQKKVDCPVVYIPTSGYDGDMYDGHAEFTRELLKRVDWKREPELDTVNIIGHVMESYEMDQVANVNEMKRMLHGIGIKTGAFFYSGQKTGQLMEAWRGAAHVAMPYYGAHADTLEVETNRPVVKVDLPMGTRGSANWLRAAAGSAGKRDDAVEKFISAEMGKVGRLLDIARPYMHGIKMLVAQPAPLAAGCAAVALEMGLEVRDVLLLGETHGGAAEFRGALSRLAGPDESHEAMNIVENARWSDLARVIEVYKDNDEQLVAAMPSLELNREHAGRLSVIELGCPSNNKHFIYTIPYMGFNGAVALAQRIMDASIRRF